MDKLPTIRIGLVSISDRASSGVYLDEGLPALRTWLERAVSNPVEFVERLIPDEQAVIEDSLRALADQGSCALILTTGGTGPAPRDVTPEATLAVADRVMPGFGEQMRQGSLYYVPTTSMARQVRCALQMFFNPMPSTVMQVFFQAEDGIRDKAT